MGLGIAAAGWQLEIVIGCRGEGPGCGAQDEPHCHLLMMIIYCPEGLTLRPLSSAESSLYVCGKLLGGNDFRFRAGPRAWANICHGFLFPQPGQTNCLQYLLFVRCSAAVDNDEMATGSRKE